MTTTTKQNGITYVERDYKCLDCDWAWTQVCIKGDPNDKPVCPNCQNIERGRLTTPSRGEEIKSKTGKKIPKRSGKIAVKPGMPAYSPRAASRKEAANLAFDEAQKQGFTDMKDSNLREGDLCAPPLTSLVSTVQDKVFHGGWTGGQSANYSGGPATDAGGASAMANLQSGLMKGGIPDKLGGVGNLKK